MHLWEGSLRIGGLHGWTLAQKRGHVGSQSRHRSNRVPCGVMKPFLGLLRNLLRRTEVWRTLGSACGVCMRWLTKSAERALHWWLPAHHTSQSEKPNTSALLIPYHRLVLIRAEFNLATERDCGTWGVSQEEPWRPRSARLGQADPSQGMQWVASQNMQWPGTKSQAARALSVPQKQPQGPEWSPSSVPRMSCKEH